ncbi:hypothetical protein BG004_001919 [Podila humilis]|nr:hypothetical protein BG004_001919 [Podila humilis]
MLHPRLNYQARRLAHESRRWVDRSKGLRPRRQSLQFSPNAIQISTPFQDEALSIPEIQSHIASFLPNSDLRQLMVANQSWFEICASLIYKTVSLHAHRRTRVYPKFQRYGNLVRTLRLTHTHVHGTLHLVEQATQLRQLELYSAPFSKLELDQVLSAANSGHNNLTHLTFGTKVPTRRRPYQQPADSSSGGGSVPLSQVNMLSSVTQLLSLEHLEWGGMTLHVNEILCVLKACPRLVSLSLTNLIVARQEREVETSDLPQACNDNRIPIADTDRTIGRRLQKLAMCNVKITDDNILYLLGIDMERSFGVEAKDVVVEEEKEHNDESLSRLVHLRLRGTENLTFRSCSRIFEECSRLQYVDIMDNEMSNVDLFYNTNNAMASKVPWKCSGSIKHLQLTINPRNVEKQSSFGHVYGAVEDVPNLTTQENHQIYTRLRSMISLETLNLKGYGLDVDEVLEDMSFAKHLCSATIEAISRTPYNQLHVEEDVRLAKASEWVARNPAGWRCAVDKSYMYYYGRLMLYFKKTK